MAHLMMARPVLKCFMEMIGCFVVLTEIFCSRSFSFYLFQTLFVSLFVIFLQTRKHSSRLRTTRFSDSGWAGGLP